MAIELIWESESCLLVKYFGQVKGSEALTSSLAMSDDPRFDRINVIIVDGSGLETTVASDKDVDKIAAVSGSVQE